MKKSLFLAGVLTSIASGSAMPGILYSANES
jgi:hypothetical protein